MTAITWRANEAPRSQRNKRARLLGRRALATFLTSLLALVFILPLIYMLTASFQSSTQQTVLDSPLYPAKQVTYTWHNPQTDQNQDLVVYSVPHWDGVQGHVKDLAPIETIRINGKTQMVDPSDGKIYTWTGEKADLKLKWVFSLQTQNFNDAWNLIVADKNIHGIYPAPLDTGFPMLFMNTLLIALIGTFGAVISGIIVAYGFARFRFPGRDILFIVLIGTILLPFQVVLIPQYIMFTMLGWNGSWLPLLVPHFFANAYNVFLLRQYFMTLPRELDEAAMMDGAGPIRTLVSVIIPQSWPAIISVCLFHFFFAWNDFLAPLVYLSSKADLQPISIGLNSFNTTYRAAGTPGVIQAGALMAMVLPVAIFFVAQRVFMRGVVISGVEK